MSMCCMLVYYDRRGHSNKNRARMSAIREGEDETVQLGLDWVLLPIAVPLYDNLTNKIPPL